MDYKLKKIYDAVYQKEKPAKVFRSLAESYEKIYEQDVPAVAPVAPTSVTQTPQQQQTPAPTPAVTAAAPVQQPTTNSLLNNPQELNKFVDTPVLQRRPWNNVQKELFNNLSVTGIGRGELSVCSIFTGTGDIEENKKIVSGSSESYDVSFTINNHDYLFEVKEISKQYSEADVGGSYGVRIGQEGAAAARALASTVNSILKEVLSEYELLDETERKTVNSQIINLYFPENTSPVLKGKESKAHEKRVEEYLRKTNWTVAGYVNAIISDLGELTQPLLFTDYERNQGKLNINSYGKEKKKYAYFSVKSLLQAINILASQDVETANTSENPRIQSLKDVFNKNYGTSPKVANNPSILDREAIKVDKKLSKETGISTDNYTAKTFFTSVKNQNLITELDSIRERILSSETLMSFFPHNLTGFFAVNKNGYIYAPREKLSECLEFLLITQGRPKVILKDKKQTDVNV
jgi:hypothetical protein